MTKIVFVAAVTLGSALAGDALAQESARAAGAALEPAPRPDSESPWQAEIGYRGALVRDAGYDPFSTNDWLGQLTLSGSRVLVTRGRFALAVGAAWDYGHASATARGAASDLTVHRLTVPLTVRYSLARWLYLYATVAPGAAHEDARLADPSAPAPLVHSAWLASADASAGAAYSFLETGPVSWWLRAELGYGLTAPMSLAMSPDLPSSDPRTPTQLGTTGLGSLALSGSFGRVALAVAF
jgi:hypothetical protein